MIKRHQLQGKHFNLTRYLKYENTGDYNESHL